MSGLASKSRSAVLWNTGFNLFRDLQQFALMLVMVRILPTEAYGHFGFVNSVIAVIAIFSFNNFVAFTLQVKNEADTHYQTHFTAGAALNGAMFLVTNLVALGLGFTEHYAVAAPLIHIMSLGFILDWPTQLYCRMLERNLDFQRLRTVHAIGILATASVAIAMAFAGCGSYTLLVPTLATPLVFLVDFFFIKRWRPTWEWSWENFRPAWRFGVTRIGSELALNGRTLLESTVLGAALGFAALGVYNRSIGLAQLFCFKVATQLLAAIYPVLLRASNTSGQSERASSLVLQFVAWTVVPTATCFALLAAPVVKTVYGQRWEAVIPLVPWAMAWGVVAALLHVGYMLLLARHMAPKCFTADLLQLGATALCLGFALPQSTITYLGCLVGAQSLIAMLIFYWLRQTKTVTLTSMLEAVAPPAFATALAAGLVMLLARCFQLSFPESFWSAAAWGMSFWVSYIVALRLCFSKLLASLTFHFPGRNALDRLLFQQR